MAKPKDDPASSTTNTATPQPAERIVRLMPEIDRSKIEKEIQGLGAKLKWPHIPESMKDVYRSRIDELKASLKAG